MAFKSFALRLIGPHANRTIALMLCFVAAITKGYAITWIKDEFWMRGLGFNVVGVQVIGGFAVLAMAVPRFDCCRPFSQGRLLIHETPFYVGL
jgi:hypothetical protein